MTGTSRSPRDKFEKLNDYVSIYQRNEKWYANIQWHGNQIRRSLKTASKKQAQLNALALARKLMEEKAPVRQQRASIAEVSDAFLEWKRNEGLAPKSLKKYKFALKEAVSLATRLKLKHIHQINPRFMDRYHAERKENGNKPKTIFGYLVIVRGMIRFALSRQYLTADPLAGYKIKKPKPTPQPCWAIDEVEQILVRAKRLPHRDVYVVLADTGMRVGELVHLTWDDVDYQRNVILIRAKKEWKPKTGDARAIPMSDRVRSTIKAQPKRSQWVFTLPKTDRGDANGRQVSDRRLLEYLKRVLKKLNLKGHLHTFRHSHISDAVARGVAIPVLRGWVGHVDPKTLEIYTHISDQTAQDAMRRLSTKPNTSIRRARAGQGKKTSTILAHSQEAQECA